MFTSIDQFNPSCPIRVKLEHTGKVGGIFFIYLRFYIAFNTVKVISRRVVGRAEETSTYSSSGICTVNCQPTASNYQLSHLRPCRKPNPVLRGGRRECYHSATMAPAKLWGTLYSSNTTINISAYLGLHIQSFKSTQSFWFYALIKIPVNAESLVKYKQ